MYVVGAVLIYLAIEKDYEPSLLLPMGFGAILVNIPSSGALNQFMEGAGETHGIVQWLFETGIEASEAFPLLLFIGIGAMIDFGPLLSNPKMFGFCYTQLTDVEQEQNGIYTYDRKEKVDVKLFHDINVQKAAIED